MTRLSLGHLHSIALYLYLCSRGHLGVGWEPLWGAGPGLYLVFPLGQVAVYIPSLLLGPLGRAGRRPGSHQQERVQAGRVDPFQTHILEHPHLHV